MQVPGKTLGGLANTNLLVANYPVKRQDDQVVQRRRQIVLHRRMQMAVEDPASVNMRGGNGNESLVESGSGAGEKSGPVDWSALLYPVAQLTTPERMRVQLVLLEACAETIRDQFNQRFDAVVKAKADTLAKVAEKNERIKGVLEELALLPSSSSSTGNPVPPVVIAKAAGDASSTMVTDLGEGEVPERILTVEDSELAGVPKYLTEEEEARAAEQRRLEAERAKNAGDDGRTRALNVMMGGVLVKDERANAIASAATIPKPDVLESNKPKADWTEDDKRLVKEYEKKVATVREEQEKARKALESELRKLEAAADELRQALDAKVLALLEDKMATDAQVHMAQLRALILARRMDLAHHDEVALAQLRERALKCQRQLAAAQAELPDIKQASEVQKEALDTLVKKDKDIDKAYKKELTSGGCVSQQQQQQQTGANQQSAVAAAMAASAATGGGGPAASGIPADTLWKLYKKRAVNAATGVVDPGPLGDEDYIAGITPLQWSVLNDYRNRKMQVEAEIRGAMAKLKHTQRMAENLANRAESLRVDLESVNQSIDDLEEHMIAVRFDTMDLYTLKQGQVEVPPTPVVTDYSKAVLIHRAQVQELNDAIRRLGGTKLEALKEMRNYRRGILALDWETKVLEFQAGDVQLKTRDLQLLRVTKSMQEYLRSGDEGTLATMANTLERQLEYVTGSFAHKVAEREKVAKALERQLREKVKENANLTKEVGKLNALVDARARIHQLRAASAAPRSSAANPSSGRTRLEPLRAGAAGATKNANASGASTSGKHGGESDPRLAAIAQRRQLVDLARAQAQDIAVLSHEVQRWRLKTYPAFASNLSSAGGGTGAAMSPSKDTSATGQSLQQQRP
ncbi:hypothetical protein BCR44DRAFT_1436770 [Catenaria anguillulae PL171]|uniref:Uncharacterized protein n=1 Tax=Catenaria anguillulae PL171 TaxID=765915 RepID=A0A1Y2HHX5_9FUNG|nr:hypothetical protein BCR44DRAFT_1436770 [Catenaria anguillulae PL171]